MRPVPRQALPYILAFTFVGLAYISYASSSQTSEASAFAQRPLHVFHAARTGATCNLPVVDQVKAVDAFSKMVPVFRHPRCSNCHGNFDITDTNVHSGAAVVPKDLDFRQPLDVPQRQRLHAACGECHKNITGHANRPTLAGDVIVAGWMIAPAPMQWVSASNNEQLCMLVKGHEENADSFVSHVTIDHGEIQFLKAAFEGKRALDSATMDTYDVASEPPPGSLANLIAQGTRWAQLVGDHWKDSQDCGCVKPKVELIMRGEIIGRADGQAISGDFSSSVMLEPDMSSVYSGSGMVTLSNFKMPIPANCSIAHNVPPSKIVVKEVRFGDNNNNDISVLLFPENTSGSHTFNCPGLPRPITLPVITPMQQWRYVHGRDLRGTDYFIDGFQVAAQSSGGRTMVGRKEVTRTISAGGGDVTAKTIFEIWTVSRTP